MEKKRIISIVFIMVCFICAILISLFYYNNKYVVSFETGTDVEILNQYIASGKTAIEPEKPIKDGYVFIEWQKDGKTYDFSKYVKEDIILTAEWQKEKYVTITFNKEEVEKKQILECSIISNLPELKKEGYNFIGWYIEDEKYIDQVVCSDTTLDARYEKILKVPVYKVGDVIKIVGPYSNSLYGIYNYDVAIGWIRTILKIYDEGIYPYMIGNENGVTGFFKLESISREN